ncbi:MAG: putative acetyltransferase [Alphaproteobacteria bacterium]|jgi:putative acetyltransferase|nr:putative acetyltransferase [Alphaproteobacteria bacterium]
MMARANPTFALRPYLPQDAPMLAEIFRASVEGLTEDDYNPAQQEAWAALADDLEEFASRLGKHLTLIATMQGSPVGFISLDAPTEIGLFYVHPAVAGQGIGTMLYNAVEKLSASRGTSQLSVDASDTAREFFEHRGFTPEQRNTVSVGNEWLSNTTMKKTLAANEGKP